MSLRAGIFMALGVFCLPAAPAQDAHLWLTTSSRSALLTEQPDVLHFSAAAPAVPVIDVNDMQQYQSMEGFGYALTGGSAELLMHMSREKRAKLLHEIFDPAGDGIHVSYLRISIGSSDMNDHPYTYDDMPPGQADRHLAHFSMDVDQSTVIAALREILAIHPHIRILGSPWSAPAWMKDNDNLKGGHLKRDSYAAYAEYFVHYIQGLQAEGINIDAITVQNEPLNPKNTPSMVMFEPEEDIFIAQYLGPAFAKAGIHTGIQIYDHNADVPSYPLSILADPAAHRFVTGIAMHLYGGDASVFTRMHDQYPREDIFLTEQSITQPPNAPTLNIDEPVDRVLIGATRNWCRNVLLWNLAADPNARPHTSNGGCTSCYGALTLDGDSVNRNVAWYALAHFSKFVPPGSVHIASGTLEQLDSAAFLTPEGKVVLVVSNTGNFPYRFAIRYHGRYAAAILPEESVGTYVW